MIITVRLETQNSNTWIKAAKRPSARAAANRRETPEALSDASVASNDRALGLGNRV
jgi:hypothetical protein